MSRAVTALLGLAVQVVIVVPADGPAAAPPVSDPASVAAVSPADVFQRPLSSWSPHCLGFGSQWRYCNGVALRACSSGAVWLHTGVDVIASVGQPVMAAGDGEIVGYLIDAQFRGGVLIRHQTTAGVVITQYWHVWLRSAFSIGSGVTRGQVFADVADMGSRTHLHFAVFNGGFEPHAWNGALPPSACSGFPAFPYRFVDPNAFLEAHQRQLPLPLGVRF